MYRMEQNRGQSPLLRLPGGIRNQIYRHLIKDDLSPYWLTKNQNIYRCRSNLERMPMGSREDSYTLTGICREIRSEFGSFLTSMDEVIFWYPVHLYQWAKPTSESTKRGVKSVLIRIIGGNPASTLRRYMAALRTLPEIEQVEVKTSNEWKEEIPRQLRTWGALRRSRVGDGSRSSKSDSPRVRSCEK